MMISRANLAPAPLASDEALAILAHELRDPLGALLFALDGLPRDVDPDVRRAHSIAQRQARRAVKIVEDFFDLCRASRDRLSLRKEVVQLADIVARATQTTAHLLAVRGNRLTVSLTTSPRLLFADPLRLEQVLTNLLANAAKYTDPGGDIRLTANAEAGQIILRVQDNGRGIAPELLPRVFDRFCVIGSFLRQSCDKARPVSRRQFRDRIGERIEQSVVRRFRSVCVPGIRVAGASSGIACRKSFCRVTYISKWLRSQCRGRGFNSLPLHFTPICLSLRIDREHASRTWRNWQTR
jgi:signal transduction histidine kinase